MKDKDKDEGQEGNSLSSVHCLKGILYTLGISSILMGIFLMITLIYWSINMRPDEQDTSLSSRFFRSFHIFIRHFRWWHIVTIVGISFCFILAGILTVYGTYHSSAQILVIAFIILGVKYMHHIVIFFSVIFLKLALYKDIEEGHETRSLSQFKCKRGENFLLTISVFPMLIDLFLMAANSDFRYTMKPSEEKKEEKIKQKITEIDSKGKEISPTTPKGSPIGIKRVKSDESIVESGSIGSNKSVSIER